MAGRKQHFIPRHFLKAFVIPDGNDKLWMYRRGLPNPVPVSRDDAAAARDFYSRPAVTDAPTLDDLITEYENELESHVEAVRAISTGQALPAKLISEIVAHLTMRAAYLREFIDAGASELVSSIDTLIHRPTEILESIVLPRHRVPSKFEDVAIAQFDQHMLSSFTNVTPKAIVRLLYQEIREDYDRLQRAASSEFANLLARFQGVFQATARTAHVQVLEKGLVSAPRKDMLEELEWRVLDFPTGDAVLPDCVAIAEDADGWGPYLMTEHKSMARVAIPLSSSKLAVGTAADDWEGVLEIYNQAARDSCFAFYLANKREEVPQTHLAELGGSARAKIADITSSALREAIGEFIGDDPSVSQEETQPVKWADLSAGTNISYSVSFRDFGDEPFAARVAKRLNEVVKGFGGYLPIHRLDGVTFAVDYSAAVQELDRGLGVARTIDPSADTNPNGVAMPLAVRRDDGIRTHIVFKGYLAEQLISEDESLNEDATMVVCFCLGIAAFNALTEGKFPGTLLSPYRDPYEGWLYQYNDTLLATYFSSRLLSPSRKIVEFYAGLVLLQLDQMISATTDAHTQYQTDGDHECLFEICAIHVSDFMMAMTRFLAVHASVIGPHRPNGPLDKSLSQLELMKWSKLFQEDLAAFNHGLDDWTNLADIHFLNRHFERLLFEVGVLPDQMNDGSLYIHTSDEQSLASRLRDSKKSGL